MKISVIGTGYVGLVAAAAFADHGNDVICADIDESKINTLKAGQNPIFEPGLDELIARNSSAGRLKFTTSNAEAAIHGEVIFLAVGTPTESADGSTNLNQLLTAAREIAQHITHFTVLVNKSTVPVGTAERVHNMIADLTKVPVVVVSNPEFLKEGSAVADFMQPDRVIIGTSNSRAQEILRRLYQPFFRTSNRLLVMDESSAEMTKYACNAYLATRISFINDIANLCDAVGADVERVRQGMGSDQRIGNKFLFPGIGYGGSCFPKDTRSLIRTARENGLQMSIIAEADRINETQKLVLVRKVRKHFSDGLKGKRLAIWGLSFKPNTDDVREAPALTMVRAFVQDNVEIRVCDPIASKNFVNALGPQSISIDVVQDPYEAARGADALILATEWREFRSPDFSRLAEEMRNRVLFDGRNQWDRSHVESYGFRYFGIGR